jgi:hypothetical protein
VVDVSALGEVHDLNLSGEDDLDLSGWDKLDDVSALGGVHKIMSVERSNKDMLI